MGPATSNRVDPTKEHHHLRPADGHRRRTPSDPRHSPAVQILLAVVQLPPSQPAGVQQVRTRFFECGSIRFRRYLTTSLPPFSLFLSVPVSDEHQHGK